MKRRNPIPTQRTLMSEEGLAGWLAASLVADTKDIQL